MARADALFGGEDPWSRANRLAGVNWTPRRSRANLDSNRGFQVRRIARGTPNIPASVTRNYNRTTGGGFRYNPERVESAIDNIFSKLADQYQENVAERDAITRIAEQNTANDVEDRPWYGDLWHAVSGIGESGEEGGFGDSIVGRALDIVSRPAYGVFEGMESVAQESRDNTLAEGGDIASDFFGGFWRGLTGQDKTGFGDVYEAVKENPETRAGEILRAFEEEHPRIEQTVAQATGLAGELGLDPLNVLVGAAPTVMRSTDLAQRAGTAGRLATDDVFKETILRAASEVTDDFATGSHLVTGAYAQNPALLNARIRNSIEELFNDSNLSVQGGGRRGRRTMNNRVWPAVVANRTQTEVQEAITEFFNSRVDDLWNRRGSYTPTTVNAYRQYSNDFDEFWRNLEKSFPATATTDDILDALKSGRVTKNTVDAARDAVLAKYGPELQKVHDQVFELAKNPTYRTIGLRLGNKTVPFRLPGRAYDYFGTKLADHLIPNRADAFDRTFFESVFSGILGVKATQARAVGLTGMDKFRKDLQKFSRDYSVDQAKELQRLLEKGVHHTGNKLIDDGLAFLRAEYDKMFQEEQLLGARPVRDLGSQYGDNYTYIYLRGGNRDARTRFKDGRKRAWNDPNSVGPEKYDLAYAKEQGLKPVEHAFENLFLRRAKSGRDQVRSAFVQDIVDNYSVFGGKPVRKLSERSLEARNLEQVPYNWLNQSFRQMADAKGGVFYLPKEMANVIKRFNEMTGWTSAEWGKLGRAYAKTINLLKATLTLPFTGFHAKNMIGDVFMGLMDDVNPNDYARVARKFTAHQAGKSADFDFVPGLKFTWNEFYGKFLDNADAGFFDVEFGSYNSLSAGAIPRRMGRKVVNKVREWSDARETIPRFVHFETAYRDEAARLWKAGKRNLNEIDKLATDAAVWRVNSYKFDYSALLPWEKKAKTLAFPFYTYLRKALPILVEQMFMNPHYLSTANRFMEYNDGSAADAFNSLNVPQWIQDLGFGLLSDEKEPMAVTADILPLGALDILSSLSPTEIQPNAGFDPKDLFREGLSNLNPIAQAPIEYATGQTLFDERPIDDNFMEYVISNLPIIHDVQEEVVDIPGLPGGGNKNNAVWDYLFGEPDRPLWESIISNRFAGAGLPVRRISEGQQFQQQQANVDQLIEEPLREFNRSQDRYYISTTERFTFRLNDRLTGQELGEFQTPGEAIEAASRYPSYQEPRVPPYSPPDMSQVFESLLNQR